MNDPRALSNRDDVALAVHSNVNCRLREARLFCDVSKARQEGTAGRLSARLGLYVAEEIPWPKAAPTNAPPRQSPSDP